MTTSYGKAHTLWLRWRNKPDWIPFARATPVAGSGQTPAAFLKRFVEDSFPRHWPNSQNFVRILPDGKRPRRKFLS